MTLNKLNSLPEAEAQKIFHDCNAAEKWSSSLAANRPFADVDALKKQAESVWNTLGEADFLQAFEAHPMIGDVDSLRKKYASTKTMASGEQSGATGADEEILRELAALNRAYLEKFGFIFIVFATGKSAAEMLAILKGRISNDRAAEIRNAGAEQLKITLLRLEKLLETGAEAPH